MTETTSLTKSSRTRLSPSASNAVGALSSFAKGSAEGASVCQPSVSPGAICLPPSHGTLVEALRPA